MHGSTFVNPRFSPPYKQLYWANVQNPSQFPASFGLFVSSYNTFFTVVNSLVFVYRVSRGKTNPLSSGWMQWLGLGLVLAGNVGEILAERGRAAFKKEERNKGKIYQGGLLSSPTFILWLHTPITIAAIHRFPLSDVDLI